MNALLTSDAIELARKVPHKPGKAPSRRHGTLVRMGDDVAADARVAASLLGVSMAEYLTETLRPIVKKTITDELRKRVEGGGK